MCDVTGRVCGGTCGSAPGEGALGWWEGGWQEGGRVRRLDV